MGPKLCKILYIMITRYKGHITTNKRRREQELVDVTLVQILKRKSEIMEP